MIHKLKLGVLLVFLLGTFLFASTPVFTPDSGFLFLDSAGLSLLSDPSVFLFQNPARLVGSDQHHFRLSAQQDFLGYNRVMAGYVLPAYEMTLGVGYTSFYASDLSRNRLNGDARPEATGESFSDRYDVLRFCAAFQIQPGLRVAASAQQLKRELYKDSAEAYSVDAGVAWDVNDGLSLGAYSRYFLGTDLVWSLSGASETLPRAIIAEIVWVQPKYEVSLATDFSSSHFLTAYALDPHVLVFGDAVFHDTLSVDRFGYGTALNFGPVSLQYMRVHYTAASLGTDQDLFTLGVQFGGVIRLLDRREGSAYGN